MSFECCEQIPRKLTLISWLVLLAMTALFVGVAGVLWWGSSVVWELVHTQSFLYEIIMALLFLGAGILAAIFFCKSIFMLGLSCLGKLLRLRLKL